MPGATSAPFYLAEELGFFASPGIALDQVFFPSASEVIPALTRGDLDGAIKGPADLRGRKVALTPPGLGPAPTRQPRS